MSITLRLALASLAVGCFMGLVVAAAAWAGGRARRLPFFLAGSGWGVLVTGLILTDCLPGMGPGPVSESSFTLFFGGMLLFPPAISWGQDRRVLRWLYSQLVMLLNLVPGFVMAVTAALCTFT